jgi:hypothetical protein
MSESEQSQNDEQNESESEYDDPFENDDLPLNFFLLEKNPYMIFFYNEKEIDKSNIILNVSPSIKLTFSHFNLIWPENERVIKCLYLEDAKKLKKKYQSLYLFNKEERQSSIYKVQSTNELNVDYNDYRFLSNFKSFLPNLGDFQQFFDKVYDLTQTRRQRLFLELWEKKSYLLYSLAFYKSQSNKNETIYLTLSDLPYVKEPVKQEIVKLNTVYYALNGVRFNTDNKFISTILTEDSLLSIIKYNEKDPLTNLKIEKIDPVLFVLKDSEPQQVPFVFVNPRKNLKRTRSFGGGLKLKKRLKSKSPKKINRKKSLKKKSKKMKR